MKKTFTLIAACSLLIFGACKKTSEPGPTGPAGATGNANVKSELDTAFTWTYGSTSYGAAITVSNITQDIVDNGAVLVYMKVGTDWQPLPYTFFNTSAWASLYSFSYSLSTVNLKMANSDLFPHTNPGTKYFKTVCIASGVKKLPADIKFWTYEKVKKEFQLED